MTGRWAWGLPVVVALALAAGIVAGKKFWRSQGDYAGFNLLLVTLDTTRADFLGCYDPRLGEMPGVDLLASEGVVFESAVSPTTTTVPSHASLLTGVYPRRHGLLHNVQSLGLEWTTMAELFRRSGYRTAAFLGARGIIRKNLARGFQVVDDEVPPREPLRWQRSASVTNQLAFQWLETVGGDPFFLWIHYYDPHSPMGVSPAARRSMPDYAGAYRDGFPVSAASGFAGVDTLAAEDFRFLRLLYEEEVRATDRELRALLERVIELGLWSRTFVVVAGDHGQSLGEKGYIGHDGVLLHEPLLHVPLLLRFPPDRHGRRPALRDRVPEPVGLCDVLPTVLDLFGFLEPPSYPLSGRSLLPDCLLESPPGDRGVPVFAQAPGALNGQEVTPRRIFSARRGRWKLVSGPAGTFLYDLESDPAEMHALDASRPEGAELQKALEGWLRTSSPEVIDVEAEMTEEVVEALGALGYVE